MTMATATSRSVAAFHVEPAPPAELRAALAALGDPYRQRMLLLLGRARRPLTVSALAARFALSRPAVSHHLKILRQAGLVRTEKRGRAVLCRVDAAAVRRLLDRFAAFVRGCCP
jgi:DNA-binding transcriptional ArsR family regulator